MRLPAWLTGRTPLPPEARVRLAREAAAVEARAARERDAEAWAQQQREQERAEAEAEAREAQAQRDEFEAMVKAVRCIFPGDGVERLPTSRLSGRSWRGSLVERIFGAWS